MGCLLSARLGRAVGRHPLSFYPHFQQKILQTVMGKQRRSDSKETAARPSAAGPAATDLRSTAKSKSAPPTRRPLLQLQRAVARAGNSSADVCLTRHGRAVTLPETRRKRRIPLATRRTKCPKQAPPHRSLRLSAKNKTPGRGCAGLFAPQC